MPRPPVLSLTLLGVLACSPSTPVGPAPRPTPALPSVGAIASIPPMPSAPPVPTDTASGPPPGNWQLLDESTDHIAGISSERAMHQLLATKQPKRTVIVAVIDGGVDTAHIDLKANLWLNPRAIPANAKGADPKTNYIGDVRGWNFIGGSNGRDVDHDTFEVTRQYAGCKNRATGGNIDALLEPDRSRCKAFQADFDKQKSDAEQELPGIEQADQALTQVTQVLRQAAGADSLADMDSVVARLRRQPNARSPQVIGAMYTFTELEKEGITRSAIDDAKKEITARIKYSLDPTYNPRSIVGDDTTNLAERHYGNADVMGPDAEHGTHVSGIIGAIRGNGIGIDGIAPAVKIMIVRAIPDGDERDKDVANAIRYAVDNGANVINMSFGKSYSPAKAAVDDAVKYADSHGVLMVHAAGNDNANSDSAQDFPNPYYLGGGRAQDWIEVGASSWKGGDSLVAPFSNYGHERVDLFAPGVDILSTVPGNRYERDSGTSMASPVVAGVAALLMAYYPALSAAEIRQVLLASATRHTDQMVALPGSLTGREVPFGTLSATGGIVNAYAAVLMAEELTRAKR